MNSMSENEKDIIKRLAIIVPQLSKDKQNYILGIAEGMAIIKEEIADKEKENMRIEAEQSGQMRFA